MHIIPKVCKLCYCSTLKVRINDAEKFQALLGLFCEVDVQGVFIFVNTIPKFLGTVRAFLNCSFALFLNEKKVELDQVLKLF